MSRHWTDRKEPRVKQPRKPYRWYGHRVKNNWSGSIGTIVEALWDGWHWELKVAYEDGNFTIDNPMSWDTANFWQHHRPLDKDGKVIWDLPR